MAFWPDDGIAPVGGLAPVDAALGIDSATFDWEASPAAFSWAMDHVTSEGVMYVLTTVPGARAEGFSDVGAPVALHVSTDGVTWDRRPIGGAWIHSMAVSGGKLHAIGTVPGPEEDSSVVQVGTSLDRGVTFSSQVLPFPRVDSGVVDTRILANGGDVLALVTLTEMIDVMSLLPPEVQESGGYPLVLTDRIGVFPGEVVALVDLACYAGDRFGGGEQPECEDYFESDAIYVATWEELGRPDLALIDGVEAGRLELGSETTRGAFLGTGGGAFEEVDFPFLPDWIDQVFDVGDTTVVAVSGVATRLMASDDLRTWEPIAENVEVGWFVDVDQVGEEFVLVGGEGSEPIVYRTDDLFGEWNAVEVGDLLPSLAESSMWITSASVGPGGVAISIGGEASGSDANPVADLINQVLPGGQAAQEQAVELSVVLVSRDLANWNLLGSDDIGGVVEQVFFSPQGDLIATVHDSRGRRLDVVARP